MIAMSAVAIYGYEALVITYKHDVVCLLFPYKLVTRFDEASRMAFIGDYSGNITVLKLDNNTCTFISELKGHMGQ